jgi:hypothetical protein
MQLRRERILLLAVAVGLFFSAVMCVRQVIENQSRHSEMREAFIFCYEKNRPAEAQRLYDRLKYDMPAEPTRHLVDDLERVAPIAPTNQSPSSNLLVRYHLSVQREVEKRVEQKFLKSRPSAETGS